MNFIAKTFDEVGKSAIDFHSFNHIIFGYVAYLLVYIIGGIFFSINIRGYYIAISITLGIIWEVFENIGYPNAFFRIWGKDSLENSLMDIVFDVIGVMIGFALSIFDDLEIMVIGGFIVVLILVFLMYLGIKLTQNKST